jgi:hypothetical protein
MKATSERRRHEWPCARGGPRRPWAGGRDLRRVPTLDTSVARHHAHPGAARAGTRSLRRTGGAPGGPGERAVGAGGTVTRVEPLVASNTAKRASAAKIPRTIEGFAVRMPSKIRPTAASTPAVSWAVAGVAQGTQRAHVVSARILPATFITPPLFIFPLVFIGPVVSSVVLGFRLRLARIRPSAPSGGVARSEGRDPCTRRQASAEEYGAPRRRAIYMSLDTVT